MTYLPTKPGWPLAAFGLSHLLQSEEAACSHTEGSQFLSESVTVGTLQAAIDIGQQFVEGLAQLGLIV